MPTYEYQCSACGHHLELFQQMSDEPLKKCPQCGAAIKRLIGTGSGVIFKGSGFHCNDYQTNAAACNRSQPCCGRDNPCDKSPRK